MNTFGRGVFLPRVSPVLLAVFALTVALFVLCGGKAQAGLHICNKTSNSVSVAVAMAWDWDEFDDYPYHWRVWGWWNIDAGDCKTPIGNALDTTGDTEYYYYAHDSGSDVWDGKMPFCVDADNAFDYNEDEETKCATGAKRNFRSIKTGSSSDFTLSLTP